MIVRTVDYLLWTLTLRFTEDPKKCSRLVEGLE